MLFPTLGFLLFFLIVAAAMAALGTRFAAKKTVLVVASYYFYAQWDWRFFLLLARSSAQTYGRADPERPGPALDLQRALQKGRHRELPRDRACRPGVQRPDELWRPRSLARHLRLCGTDLLRFQRL